MAIIVPVLLVLGAIAGLVTLWFVIVGFRLRDWGGLDSLRTKGVLRGAGMTALWIVAAVALDFGYRSAPSFRGGVPLAILVSDLGSGRYAPTARAEVVDRVVAGRLDDADVRRVTERMVEVDVGWPERDAGRGAVPEAGLRAWFRAISETGRVDRTLAETWLRRAPPPIFDGPREPVTGVPGWIVDVAWGRDLSLGLDLPYEIGRFDVESVRVDGTPVTWSIEPAPGSDDRELGHYARMIRLVLHVEPPADETASSRDDDTPRRIEIDYRVSLGPLRIRGLGPFTWTATTPG